MSKISYYYNGKRVARKKDIPKGAKFLWEEFKHNMYYGDDEHKKKQDDASYKYLREMRERMEDMNRYHG